MRTVAESLSYLRTFVVTLPLVYLSTVFFGTISLVVSVFDASGRGQHACARAWARSLLLFARVRVTVRGLEHLEPGRTYIFASNHQSYMDIPVAFAHLPVNFRIMAKATLFHIPFLGWHLRRSGHLPVARDNPRRAARSLLEAATHIRGGTPVFVFPEGGRSYDGQFREFRAGTFLLAIKAGVPVVPVTLNGTRALLKMHSWNLRPGRVEMILHAPIPTEGLRSEAAEDLCARVREVIAASFDFASATSAD
jgi:1-acyl-sn-glycerol-3-phosphate acyltransferase